MKIRTIFLKESGNNILKYEMFYNPLIMIVLTVILSASSTITPADPQKENNLKDKKIDLLEKLENGKQVNSEDIRALFKRNDDDNFLLPDADISSPLFIQGFPEKSILRIHRFCGKNNDHDCGIFKEKDLREINEGLSENLKEIGKEIESLINSEDFLKIRYEIRKCADESRKELKAMKETTGRSAIEIRSRVKRHSFMQ